jgi:CrcB protein
MNPLSFAVVGIGAALGAWLRWLLSAWLNPVFAPLPLGTLAANLAGGLLMGVAMGLMSEAAAWSQEMRLFSTTGFLGGLTTFSTFSGEAASLVAREEYGWTAVLVSVHVAGSIAATLGGIALVKFFVRA